MNLNSDAVIANKARLELVGHLFRWITPILIALSLFLMNGMNATLETIQLGVNNNHISNIKLEANQQAFWNSFNDYRIEDKIAVRGMVDEVDEINTEIDDTVNKLHMLEVEVNRYHNRDSRNYEQ